MSGKAGPEHLDLWTLSDWLDVYELLCVEAENRAIMEEEARLEGEEEAKAKSSQGGGTPFGRRR